MSPKFLLDEQLRSRAIWDAIQARIAAGIPLDVLRVGDPGAPPPATPDPQVLEAAAAMGRILLSRDVATMPEHFAAFLGSGRSCSGIVILHGHQTVSELVRWLEFLTAEAAAHEFVDQIIWIP